MENTYFVIIYAIYNDGKAPKKAIYDASDRQDAINIFHRNMATYGEDPTVEHALVQAQGVDGMMIRQETTLPKPVETPVEE